MNYYEIWQDMSIGDQWFLGDPIDGEGNEIYGWHFSIGEKYIGPAPKYVKIKQNGVKLPFSYGGLDVPYVSEKIKDSFESVCGDLVQFIPVEVESVAEKFFILNVVKLIDAIDNSSEVELYRDDEVQEDPTKINQYRYIRRLVLNRCAIPDGLELFRLKKLPS